MTIWTRLRQILARAAPETAAAHPPRRKDGAGAGAWSWIPGWDGAWGGRSYAARVEAGYRRNPVAYRCVRLIAECAASVPLRLARGGAALSHPVQERLLRHPNPGTSGAVLFDRLYTMLLLAGEAYLLRLPEDAADTPQEFHLLPPERMRREGRGRGPWPARYVLEGEEGRRVFPLDPLTGRGAVLHLVEPHPRDPLTPLARAEVAADAVDVHNAAQAWNKALLDNAARPSGAFVVEARDGAPASLSESQFARLKSDIETLFQGARNAGRPLLLEGGLKWQPMAFSPADMDFINLKHTAARDIALAFGVPPMLLGIPGDNTYSNYQEANRAFWRLTVLPLVTRVADELTAWLVDALPADARFAPDRDAIARRTGERDSFWRELDQLSFLTTAEKRTLAGVEELLAATGSRPPSAPAGLPADVETRHMHWRTEPRIPKGRPGGGRWTTADGVSSSASSRRSGSTGDSSAGTSAGGHPRKKPRKATRDQKRSDTATASSGSTDAAAPSPRADRSRNRPSGAAREAAQSDSAPAKRTPPAAAASTRRARRSLFREDRAFIEEKEGGLITTARVPQQPDGTVIGKSGATIGAGVDLGQQSEADLRAAGVPEPLIEKVRPYLGRKKEEARRFLAAHPLTLSEEEARILTDRLHDRIIRQVAKKYDDAAPLRFADLPPEAQTVIADIAIQFGPDLERATPRFWRFVTTAQWARALDELRHFGDRGRGPDGRPVSSKRREDEADKWEQALKRFPRQR